MSRHDAYGCGPNNFKSDPGVSDGRCSRILTEVISPLAELEPVLHIGRRIAYCFLVRRITFRLIHLIDQRIGQREAAERDALCRPGFVRYWFRLRILVPARLLETS